MTDNVSDLALEDLLLGEPDEQGKGGRPYPFPKAKASNFRPKAYLYLI